MDAGRRSPLLRLIQSAIGNILSYEELHYGELTLSSRNN